MGKPNRAKSIKGENEERKIKRKPKEREEKKVMKLKQGGKELMGKPNMIKQNREKPKRKIKLGESNWRKLIH